MGCCGDREKGITVTEEQKWDYIVRRAFYEQAGYVLTSTHRPSLTSSRPRA